jgi:hypothetical protein
VLSKPWLVNNIGDHTSIFIEGALVGLAKTSVKTTVYFKTNSSWVYLHCYLQADLVFRFQLNFKEAAVKNARYT